MPRIFEKNCKIKVIEYGSDTIQPVAFNEIFSYVSSYLKGFFKA